MLTKKDILWLSGVTLGVLLAAGALVVLAVFNGIDEYYSRGRPSTSSDAARARKVFVQSPAVHDSLVAGTVRTIRMLDIWIEEDNRTEYRFFYFPRLIREGTYTLVLHTTRPGLSITDEQIALLVLSAGGALDTLRPSGWSGNAVANEYSYSVRLAFPDSVRLVAVRR